MPASAAPAKNKTRDEPCVRVRKGVCVTVFVCQAKMVAGFLHTSQSATVAVRAELHHLAHLHANIQQSHKHTRPNLDRCTDTHCQAKSLKPTIKV